MNMRTYVDALKEELGEEEPDECGPECFSCLALEGAGLVLQYHIVRFVKANPQVEKLLRDPWHFDDLVSAAEDLDDDEHGETPGDLLRAIRVCCVVRDEVEGE